MSNANIPPDDLPLVIKTTSMYKVFQEVDALLEEAYSVIGKRPMTNPYSDDIEHPFAMIPPKPAKLFEVDAVKKIEAGLIKLGLDSPSFGKQDATVQSDSYETAGSEIDENENIKSKKKTTKAKAKNTVKSSAKRQTSKSPAKGRSTVHSTIAVGDTQFEDSEDAKVLRQFHKSTRRSVGGDADNSVNFNEKINEILDTEESSYPVRNRSQNN